MKRKSKKVNPIPLAGYIPLEKLLELNRDAIRAIPKNEKQASCKALLREIISWSTYSPFEAIGLLNATMYHFLQLAEDEREKEDKKK